MKKIAAVILLFITALTFQSQKVYAVDAAITGPSVIYKAANSLLSLSDIISLYRSDTGAVALSSDGYTGNGSTIGTYEIVLSVSNGMSVTEKPIEIIVVATFGTIKIRAITDNGHIHTSTEETLSHYEIIKALSLIDVAPFNDQTSSAYLLNDQYSANAKTPGTYQFSYRIIDIAGYDNTYHINIFVSNNQQLLPPAINMGNKGNFDWTLLLWLGAGFVAFNLFKKGKKKASSMSKPYY